MKFSTRVITSLRCILMAFLVGGAVTVAGGSVAVAQEGAEGSAAQEGEVVDPAVAPDDEQVSSPTIDPADLPAVDVGTTSEQEAALRLVEDILAEQRLLLAGQNFVYQAGGRRDPFRSLLALRQREISAPELRPPGLPGALISEVEVAAIASFQGRWQAMVVSQDGRTFFVEVGAILFDGRIVEISGDEVIFEQDVEDLLGARSTRRVSKRLVTGTQEN
jgi:hypothetical protein